MDLQGGVESPLRLGGVRRVSSSAGHVCTNAPFESEPSSETFVGALVDEFIKALNGQCKDPTVAEVTITTEGCVCFGVAVKQRSVRERDRE